jgi:hypothetical protein
MQEMSFFNLIKQISQEGCQLTIIIAPHQHATVANVKGPPSVGNQDVRPFVPAPVDTTTQVNNACTMTEGTRVSLGVSPANLRENDQGRSGTTTEPLCLTNAATPGPLIDQDNDATQDVVCDQGHPSETRCDSDDDTTDGEDALLNASQDSVHRRLITKHTQPSSKSTQTKAPAYYERLRRLPSIGTRSSATIGRNKTRLVPLTRPKRNPRHTILTPPSTPLNSLARGPTCRFKKKTRAVNPPRKNLQRLRTRCCLITGEGTKNHHALR